MAFETINLGTQPAGTGGDTARSSFEKVNRNFLAVDVLSAAMSQAQFEAIRAQNNEEFAASGFVHFGKHGGGSGDVTVNQGLYINPALVNLFRLGRPVVQSPVGLSKYDLPILNVAGITFYLDAKQDAYSGALIKFPQAPDGKTTYNKSTGVITNHATVAAAFNAQAAEPTNVEVVTDRVDMWGFEAWLEEVSTTNPYVYPNGLIQSQATTMDGVNTSASARPVTYYAVFDGDTGSKGKGLNFFALTDAQKKKVLANPKNNLYYLDDGRLVQWRLRQRTIAGAGNGDWVGIESSKSSTCRWGTGAALQVQGSKSLPNNNSSLAADFDGGKGIYAPANTSGFIWKPINTNFGVYQHISDYPSGTQNTPSVNGECYFLVCGTVNRLNQGAYHPSFNPSGTATWRSAQQPYWPCSWDNRDSRTKLSGEPTNKASCFTATLGTSGNGGFGNIGTAPWDGYNHPDKRFYDAIYADGQGGVCRDMRYSAYGVDSVDFVEADQKVKNRVYRGFESLKLTRVFSSSSAATAAGYTVQDSSNANAVVATKLFNASVGGSFLQTDVIGAPANILATPQLANGWQGSWVPVIPDGATKDYPFSRKNLVAGTITRVYTGDNGTSWISDSVSYDSTKNSMSQWGPSSNFVGIFQYQAFATQTEPAPNAALAGLVPYNVFASSDYRPENGALLGESLIGKVLKNNSGVSVNNKSLLSCAIDGSGKLTSATNFDGVTHPALTLGAPV